MTEPTHPLPLRARVRHYGQQWPEARQEGTGEVVAVKQGARGTWEYLVEHDDQTVGAPATWWNSDSTIPILVTATGRVLSEDEIEELAREAERGYDVTPFVRPGWRRGR